MKILFVLLALAVPPAFAASPLLPANPHKGMTNPPMAAPAAALTQTGRVLSTIDVPQYTYIEVSQGKKTLWLATNTIKVKKGDIIHFDQGMVMTNFYSKSLKRTFPRVLFVSMVVVEKGGK